MYEKMHAAITSHLQNHRLLFWYDPEGKHREVVDTLDAPATVLEVQNNEWWIKYHVLHQRPDDRFLIYAPHPRPDDRANWLLDLVLAGFSFSHDLSETYRSELGLGEEFREFCREHVAFFQNVRERWEPLQELVTPETETVASLAVKMMAVLTAADSDQRRSHRDFPRILFDLVEEAARGDSDAWDALGKHHLHPEFRQVLRRYLPQVAQDIQPQGALLEIVRQVWDHESGGATTAEQRNCRVLLHEWRHHYSADNRYRTIIEFAQKTLGIPASLAACSLDQLEGMHLFPAVDSELAHRLVAMISGDSPDLQRLRRIAGERRTSWWVRGSGSAVEGVYTLLVSAVDFEQALHAADLRGADATGGASGGADTLITGYLQQWHRVDRLYRSCLQAYRAAGRPGTVAQLMERIEGRYLNQFLQPLAEVWDRAVRRGALPLPEGVLPQRQFFQQVVAPYLHRGDKVVVIISDALRYETGGELEERLAGINRLALGGQAIGALCAVIPSVTAAGMAALLPHGELTLGADNTVKVDGRTVAGVDGRSGWLAEEVGRRLPGKRAAAFRARDIVSLPTAAARERIDGLDLIYLYSDGIDAVADNAKTEHNLPDAVETELEFLTTVVRKFANQLNRTHLVITADHGFLYQDSPPHEGHMIAAEKPHDGVRERRYLLGGLSPEDHFNTIPASMMSLTSELPLHVADGLFRIRKQGGGSQYVHGGNSLQELIVPLITVRVGRRDDVGDVPVVVMKASHAVITTPSCTVNFFQEEPVADKTRAITLRCFFTAADGTLLSDVVELTFEAVSRDAGSRARSAEFHFSPQAVRYNGTTITLQLEKVVGGSVVPYGSETYRYQTIGERDF